MGFRRKAALTILAIAIPVFLLMTNARIVIFSGWLYNYEFAKNDITDVTGISEPQLIRVADEIKAYFTNDQEFIDSSVTMDNGVDRQLYAGREVLHMVDVKGLIKGTQRLQAASLSVIVAIAIGSFLLLGAKRAWPFIATGVLWGCVATAAIIILAGVGSLINFDGLFIIFHELSFSNTLWELDPNTSYLLMMFPEGFFFDATMCIAGFALVQAILAGTIAGGYLWRSRHPVVASAAKPATAEG